ncbi:MAG: DEAD/DEAH box helicase family protein [Bacteroidales bacterium]|nr:DEAD/DEAH box helicase family protein [Bacteroidales bacterium]MBQ9723115.1 DEAD/DEAH box helicase family protein [Bacteroidales bacterium]
MRTIDLQIQEVEAKTLAMLKDFQRATVERIDSLYRKGQKRVLVADEVGLGKTLIARGVIAKMAKLRYQESDPLFKVVYVCSNQNIARQNIRKLVLSSEISSADDISETRLSMQHLRVEEQEIAAKEKGQYIQLIPITPQTSFRVTQGAGSIDERALMFTVLSKLPELKESPHLCDKLNIVLKFRVKDDSWNSRVWGYTKRVELCNSKTGGIYPDNVLSEIKASSIFTEMMHYINERQHHNDVVSGDYQLICKLRRLFAEISVGRLNPDLVIMDEFQRFRFLIENQNTDSKLLTDKFLTDKSENVQDLVRVLLLSATPYKLYSTPEEIQESGEDSHYAEFMSVMKFLMESDAAFSDFKTVWSDYSQSLRELSSCDISVLLMKKNKAQDAMYACMCRTERNSVMESGDYIDDSTKNEHLSIDEGDILAYLDVQRILEEMDMRISLPVDYVKSCPYIFSYMHNYEAKKKLTDYFRKHQDDIDLVRSKWLWINKSVVNKYKPLPPVNARFERLKKDAVGPKSALLLWVPPTRPYYAPQGAFKGVETFSKILVFSSWEMVPKMIASLLSYEAERLAIGRLGGDYFSKNRYPQGRLTFKLDLGRAASMTLLPLVYPNITLAGLYDPIEYLNTGITDLKVIERDIRQKVHELLAPYRNMPTVETRLPDKTWYYLVPMLFDGRERIRQWLEQTTSDEKGFNMHKEALLSILDEPLSLGKEPHDLEETIVNMVMGSPAVCSLRSYKGNTLRATELAMVFRRRFNTPDATAIVELAYSRRKDDDVHWQDVLRYCKDGNFQSMLDEYFHLIKEGENIDDKRHQQIVDSFTLHTASPEVESFNEFKARISGDKSYRERKMRSNYAVAFGKTRGEAEGVVNRKDSIQGSFNSPMRPFVLATTSIGQEGLDFHFYCRKIMHWNLPSNPVEFEQREGRINRFKCLAIRENIARKYGNIVFTKDVWQEMFTAAEANKDSTKSDLVPFWCFGKDQEVKIERLLPFYPMSRDEINYTRLIKILNYYRLSLGQPRQEELLEYVFNEVRDAEQLKYLFINLSPFDKPKKPTL